MSKIILDCICPKCYGENIAYKYDEENTNIICNCLDCGWEDSIMSSVYIMEDCND